MPSTKVTSPIKFFFGFLCLCCGACSTTVVKDKSTPNVVSESPSPESRHLSYENYCVNRFGKSTEIEIRESNDKSILIACKQLVQDKMLKKIYASYAVKLVDAESKGASNSARIKIRRSMDSEIQAHLATVRCPNDWTAQVGPRYETVVCISQPIQVSN